MGALLSLRRMVIDALNRIAAMTRPAPIRPRSPGRSAKASHTQIGPTTGSSSATKSGSAPRVGKRVHFLTTASRKVASARFRAWWIAEAWASADVTCGGLDHPGLATADVVVLSSLIGHTGKFTSHVPVIWDLTDPIWCYTGDAEFERIAKASAAITVSSQGLADELLANFGHYSTVIPDRLFFQARSRVHEHRVDPVLIWFGYGFNRYPAFSGVAPLLQRLLKNGVRFRLRIVDDQPHLPLYEADRYGLAKVTEQLPWSEAAMHDRLCEADVALLPPFPGWVGRMKSTNRWLTAAWAGLPVVDGGNYEELRALLTDADARRSRGTYCRAVAESDGNIHQSVATWSRLTEEVLRG